MQSHQSAHERLASVVVRSVWSVVLRGVSADLSRFDSGFVEFGRGVVNLDPFPRVTAPIPWL